MLNRRNFLKATGLAPVAMLTAKAVVAEGMVEPKFVEPPKHIELYDFQRMAMERLQDDYINFICINPRGSCIIIN